MRQLSLMKAPGCQKRKKPVGSELDSEYVRKLPRRASARALPVVFVFPMIGFSGGGAETAVQVGYTVADIVAKALFGIFIYLIAVRKSEADEAYKPASVMANVVR